MGSHVHRLSDVNPEARTATCAHCGPVQIVGGGLYKGKKQWRCKVVKRQQDKTPRRKEYMEAYQKDYYVRTGGAAQHKSWIKQYGLTPEDYQRLLDEQGGVCVLCRETCSTGQRLSVDHCHATGRVRGLLCRNCNRALGLVKEDVDLLRRAIIYLS